MSTFHPTTVEKLRLALKQHREKLGYAINTVADKQRAVADAEEQVRVVEANIADCQRWLDFAKRIDTDEELAAAFAGKPIAAPLPLSSTPLAVAFGAAEPVMVFCGHKGCPVQTLMMPGDSFHCAHHVGEYLAERARAEESKAEQLDDCICDTDPENCHSTGPYDAEPTMADAIRAEVQRRQAAASPLSSTPLAVAFGAAIPAQRESEDGAL